MGYTHYWYLMDASADANKFLKTARPYISKFLSAHKDIIRNEYDEPDKPFLDEEEGIRFNGIGDNGHETFWIKTPITKKSIAPSYPNGPTGFNFCKTAHKPYDIVVVGTLCILNHFLGSHIEVSSDGGALEWLEGLRSARKETGLPLIFPDKIASYDNYNPEYQQRYRREFLAKITHAELKKLVSPAVYDVLKAEGCVNA